MHRVRWTALSAFAALALASASPVLAAEPEPPKEAEPPKEKEVGAATQPEEKPDRASGARERALGSEAASPSFLLHGLQSPVRDDGIHLAGDIWIDLGYETSHRALASEPDIEFWLMSGRVMFEVGAVYTYNCFFVEAKGQLLAHVEEIPGGEFIDTDDAWVRFGMWDLWDVTVGRYEAWEVYHKGQGFERDTLEDLGAADGADIYEVNYAFYRQDGFGAAAVHAYFTDYLRMEAGLVFGNELGFNSIGVRPSAILDLDWFKLKLAGEWRRLENQEEGKKQWEEKRGIGGSLQFFFDEPGQVAKVQFGFNAAYGLVDKIDPFGKVDERGSVDTLSLGGFVNLGLWSASLGLGYNHTIQGDRQLNDQTGKVGHFEHQQFFVSLKHPIVLPQLTAKLVFAYARADLQPAFDNHRVNEMFSLRLRLMMWFR